MEMMGHQRVMRLNSQPYPSLSKPNPSELDYDTSAEISPFDDEYNDAGYMADEPLNNLMLNDSPFESLVPGGRPKTYRPMNEVELTALKKMSREEMSLAYRPDPVVQLHNKGSSQNLAVSRSVFLVYFRGKYRQGFA